MNDSQRLKLQEMISANDVEDNTEKIRELKHSYDLRENIKTMMYLKSQNYDEDTLQTECISQCSFLYFNYTDIFNKLKKNELDVNILLQFVNVLEDIEKGILDQHTGSFKVGDLLKQLYIDSALRKADKLEKNDDSDRKTNENTELKDKINISWKNYKLIH